MSVDTQDLDEFQAALGIVDEMIFPLGEKVVGTATAAVREIMAPYPPQPPRDRSKHFNTYVRGVGNYPRNAFTQDRKTGVWGLDEEAAEAAREGGKVKFTSQQMNKRWRRSTRRTKTEVVGTLKNTASYSGYVMGPKGAEVDPHQASFHAATGWVSIDDALVQAQPKIEQAEQAAITAILAFLEDH